MRARVLSAASGLSRRASHVASFLAGELLLATLTYFSLVALRPGVTVLVRVSVHYLASMENSWEGVEVVL